jgi:membrane fusion protein (multidrug efflux system)
MKLPNINAIKSFFRRNWPVIKRWLILVGVVIVIVLVLAYLKYRNIQSMIDGFKAQGEPKAVVSTIKATSDDWQPQLAAVGSLRAVRGVDLSTEVSGLVKSINFKSGDEVKAGKTLMQMVDDSDVASLRSLQATVDLAQITYTRDQQQLAAEAIAKSQVDTDLGNLKSAKANVAQQAALVAKKSIRAPFDGQLGITTVNPGQYINPGDVIVTLQQLDPIYVDFTLPQQALSQVKTGQHIKAVSDSLPGVDFDGVITAVNPIVDTATRNIKLLGTIKNPDKKLLPGMFANVRLATGSSTRYITLPQTAVTYNPYGETVYVLVPRGQENADDPNKPEAMKQAQALDKADADLKAQQSAAIGKDKKAADKPADTSKQDGPPPMVARQVFIEVGPTRGDQVAVLKGLKEGDEVVSSGQLKLKNGMLVIVNNSVLPANDPNPAPPNE